MNYDQCKGKKWNCLVQFTTELKILYTIKLKEEKNLVGCEKEKRSKKWIRKLHLNGI